MTSAVFNVVWEPYAVVVPYSTYESDISFVFQVMVAPEAVMLPAVILEITGGVVSGTLMHPLPTGAFGSRKLIVPHSAPLF